jgi:PAS domain S-box-containing protein
MIRLDPYGLGITLVGVGLVLWLVTRLLMRAVPRMRPMAQPILPVTVKDMAENDDVLLVIQPGGRVISVNSKGRAAFHLQEEEISNLERLAKRTRPSELFLGLCTREGKGRFLLDGRLVEGTSYGVPVQTEQVILLSLRFPELAADLVPTQNGLPAQALQTFTDLTQSMGVSLDIDRTLQTVMENVGKLIPSDYLEITIWNKEEENLIPYRSIGMQGAGRKVEKLHDRYQVGEGYSGYLAKERKPLLISSIEERFDIRPAADAKTSPLHSYVGVPLMCDEAFIGTLEISSSRSHTYHKEDLELLRLIAQPAAIAIHNALLFQAEKRRSAELSGLTQMAQAFSSPRDSSSLYTRLVQSISPIVTCEILGFLIYNENQHSLEGQVPFYGLPPQFVEIYRVPVLPNSQAEQTLLDRDVIISENASEDPQWVVLGLDHLAQAASLRDTVLIPLTTGGRMLGYLQASNHHDGSQSFSRDELHLLTIIANQAGPIIENTNLMVQTRQRALRAEALRRIASLASSAATLDEVLKFSLQELAHLLQADTVAVFLIDQNQGMLHLHRSSLYGIMPAVTDRSAQLLSEDAQYPFSITGSQHTLLTGQIFEEKTLIPFYQTIFEGFGICSAIAVPLVVRNQGIGEVWLGSSKPDFFNQGDLQLVMTASGLLGSVVDQSQSVAQTDESLRQRVEQMTSLTRISRELSASLDLNYLLHQVYDEALRTTHADCGTILLFDLSSPPGDKPRIRYYVGDTPQEVLSDREVSIIENGGPLNLGSAAIIDFPLPHDSIESVLAIPIYYLQRPAGLILLHSHNPNHFDQGALEITQALASQGAVVLGNAFQYEEQTRQGEVLKRELETLSKLFQVTHALRPNRPLEESLSAICLAIQEATPFQTILVSIVDPETLILRRVYGVGMPGAVWEELHSHTQPWLSIQSLLLPEYKIGSAYFIPISKTPVVPEDVHTVTIQSSDHRKETDAWDPEDMLLVPLFDSYENPLGLISLDTPKNGRQPDRATIEAVDLFSEQAGLIIENHRGIRSLEVRLSDLEAEQRRLKEAANNAQHNLPMLLHRELEQTITIQQIYGHIERIRAGLEISELASRQSTIPEIIHTLASEMITRFDLQTALIAENTVLGPRLIETLGSLPANSKPEALFGQRNPLRQLLHEGRLVLAATLENEWSNSPLLNVLGAKSFIGLPLELGGGRTAGVLIIGQKPQPPFTDQDRNIYLQLARQVSVGLQNLKLLTETQRRLREVNLLLEFSQGLGVMDPDRILKGLVESLMKVIPEAQACWVGLWSEKEAALIPSVALGYFDNDSLMAIAFSASSRSANSENTLPLPIRVYQAGFPRRSAEIHFAQDYNLPAEDLLRYRRATNGRLPVSSMLVPLRRGDNILGLVVIDNFNTPAAFLEEDESLTLSLAQQTALGLENARLFTAVEQRATQMLALNQVATMLTSSLQSDQLIDSLLNQLKKILPYETATLWLRHGDQLMVAQAEGFQDDESRVGLTVKMEDSSLFQQMVITGQVLSVGDVRSDPRFPAFLEPDKLSWLGIPLIAKSELIGAIALEKHEAKFYSSEHIQAASTFASQAAVSLENARLYEESQRRNTELDQRSQRLALLNHLSSELGVSLDVDYILRLTSQQMLGALNGTRVAAVLVGDKGEYILKVEVPQTKAELPQILPSIPLLERLQESQGIFSTSYVANDAELAPLRESYFQPRRVRTLLVIPLVTGTGVHGWLWLQSTESYRYNPSEIELARTICNQAAVAIQNARQFAETNRLTEDLEHRVEERTAEFMREHRNTQALLLVMTELTASLDLNQVLMRTLSVLNESFPADQSTIVLAQARDKVFRAGIPLAYSPEIDPHKVSLSENQIADWVIQHKQTTISDDIGSDERWNFAADLSTGFKSVLAVPLTVGEEVLGALLLFNRQPSSFIIEQVGVVEATARQISITINNNELFNLIRDQSERLGSMLRDQQIEASRSRAILEAVADGVLVTDSASKITLFNASAERILDLKNANVVGKSLEQLAGLFGKAAASWMQTIRMWSQNPSVYETGQTYAVRIDLDNGRYVEIHLAPVIWRADFLGTVSIFRDITHEVQVDRLKSEFVGNVSHELRTPMTSIKGYVEIMLMGAAGELNPQQVHFLQIVKTNTERLSALVNDLLDISRMETGRVTLSVQPVDLKEICEDVVADIQRRCQEENKPMQVSFDIPADLPIVNADMERIRQVLWHLISNGYNYTPANGCVLVRMRKIESEIQVDVQDNGIGIQEKDQHRIFERFYRGEDPLVLATSGNGLGLAIARTLVEMHHGRIWFFSSGVRGEGSTFSFTLPVYTIEE